MKPSANRAKANVGLLHLVRGRYAKTDSGLYRATSINRGGDGSATGKLMRQES